MRTATCAWAPCSSTFNPKTCGRYCSTRCKRDAANAAKRADKTLCPRCCKADVGRTSRTGFCLPCAMLEASERGRRRPSVVRERTCARAGCGVTFKTTHSHRCYCDAHTGRRGPAVKPRVRGVECPQCAGRAIQTHARFVEFVQDQAFVWSCTGCGRSHMRRRNGDIHEPTKARNRCIGVG